MSIPFSAKTRRQNSRLLIAGLSVRTNCLKPSAYEASTARNTLARKEAITTTVNGNQSETQVPSRSPSSSVLLLLVSHQVTATLSLLCSAPRRRAQLESRELISMVIRFQDVLPRNRGFGMVAVSPELTA
eukprot:scpid98225/ scgid21280/ 